MSALFVFLLADSAAGQERVRSEALDSLVATARVQNPTLRAARSRGESARARVRPAGLLPDPTAGIGIMNLPVNGRYDDMTMNAVMVGQMVPYPGRLGLQRELAEAEAAVEESAIEPLVRDLERAVRRAYYDAAYADRALKVLAQAQKVTIGLAQSAESRYAIGAASQQEVLRLQVETARIAEEAVMLVEQSRAARSHLGSHLGLGPELRITLAEIPERIRRAAVTSDPTRIRFVSAELGARAADSPLPALSELHQRALQLNPELRVLAARTAAQAVRVRIAAQAHRPDFDVELQYGQRPKRPDMVSLLVSVPIPIRRAARQQSELAAERAQLMALETERAAHALELHADIAELHGELEALRAQLALYVRSILPQGRAAFESATTGYAAGRTEFATLLENRAALFEYELAYERGLADFARKLADLERLVGAEVIS